MSAQWPLYIDKAHGRSSTLDMFEKQTGIEVTYKEVINDNQQFLAAIQEPLSPDPPISPRIDLEMTRVES